jgi:hypothetical protein
VRDLHGPLARRKALDARLDSGIDQEPTDSVLGVTVHDDEVENNLDALEILDQLGLVVEGGTCPCDALLLRVLGRVLKRWGDG